LSPAYKTEENKNKILISIFKKLADTMGFKNYGFVLFVLNVPAKI
jgi:hypothetical protein